MIVALAPATSPLVAVITSDADLDFRTPSTVSRVAAEPVISLRPPAAASLVAVLVTPSVATSAKARS